MSRGKCLGIKRELKSSQLWAPLIYVALGLIYVAEQNELACRAADTGWSRVEIRAEWWQIGVRVCEREIGHHPRAGWMCSVWRGGGEGVPEICNFKHGCIYKNARRHQLVPYVGAVQEAWRHLFMVAGIRCVLPGLKATRSSSGSRQHKRLSDVFKQDLIIPLGTLVCVSGHGVHMERL